VTRYEEIADDLRRRIESGEFPAGATLPRYEDLSTEYDTGRSTLTSALRVLEEEGYVQPVMKRGLVVRDRSTRRRLTRRTLIAHTPDGGYRFPAAEDGERWTAHGTPSATWEATPPRVAEALEVELGSPAMRRRRVMSPEGEPPWSVTDTWIPQEITAEAPEAGQKNTGRGGVLRRIEEAGHGPLSWTEGARAAMPGREEARLLGISRHMPVMEILRVGRSARTGKVVEATLYTIPCDRIEIQAELQRGPSAEWPVDY
jgi:GntR family transcriptional regulator